MFKRISVLVAAGLSGLALSAGALASGGNYAFSGGTPKERGTVAAALDASAFPWGIVPRQIEIRIGKGYDSEAWRGTISLPAAGQAASDEWAKSGKTPKRHPKPNTKRRSKRP